MRKNIAFLFLLSAIGLSAATPQFLTVRNSDGSTPSYAISDIRKVTFGNGVSGSLSIYRKSSSQVAQYPYRSLECLTFDEEQAGVAEISAGENSHLAVNYSPQSLAVEVVASENIRTVAIYGIGGNAVAVVAPDSENAVIDLSAVASGIYIVKAVTATASVTEKIVKR